MLDTNVYRARMLNVVRALQESPNPKSFTMGRWGTTCNTPACAMGHYAAREDLQDDFSLENGEIVDRHTRKSVCGDDTIDTHFNLTPRERFKLFSTSGCGHARTPQEAIAYILEVVAAKWPLPAAPVVRDFTVVREADVLVREMEHAYV
jgi:hypothetical protein